jgi:hypothetical protein
MAGLALGAEPRLLCKAENETFAHPVYNVKGDFLAFSTASQRQIFVYDFARADTHCAVTAKNPGRRFCFEPGLNRLVYRHASMGDPNRSERLLSTELYLFDPTPRTFNIGNAYGPYLLNEKLWYRADTDQPLMDYAGNERKGGLFYKREGGEFWVTNEKGDTISEKGSKETIEGGEYSPDGIYFAAVTCKPDRHILLINLNYGSTVDFGPGAHPAWSGNSMLLAFHTLSPNGEPTAVRTANMLTRTQGFIDIGHNEIVTDLALNFEATRLVFCNRNGDVYEIGVEITELK